MPTSAMRLHGRAVNTGSAWTVDDLHAYKVNVVDMNIGDFFGTMQLPPPSVTPELLTISDFHANKQFLTESDLLFFTRMHAAMQSASSEDPAVANFAVHVLRMLGFSRLPDRLVRRSIDLHLYAGGRVAYVSADICIWDPRYQVVHLLIKEDHRMYDSNGSDPVPHLFAQAVATFQAYNRALRQARLPPVETKIIPAIVMVGTTPVFYKFEITATLVESIQTAQIPTRVTFVQKLVPPVNRHLLVADEGMIPADNRGLMLSCLEAFKMFM